MGEAIEVKKEEDKVEQAVTEVKQEPTEENKEKPSSPAVILKTEGQSEQQLDIAVDKSNENQGIVDERRADRTIEANQKDDCSDLTDTNEDGEEQAPKSFPQKLLDILTNENNADVISWLPHGNGFIIHKKKTFANDILPKYFKATKFTSFTRKLNRWGFSRAPRGPETGAYFHKLFRRDKPELALQMTSNSGNKYQTAPLQQQLLPNVPGGMMPPNMAQMPMFPYMPNPMMANMTPQQQQQAMWQQQMMFQMQMQGQMMMQQQGQRPGMPHMGMMPMQPHMGMMAGPMPGYQMHPQHMPPVPQTPVQGDPNQQQQVPIAPSQLLQSPQTPHQQEGQQSTAQPVTIPTSQSTSVAGPQGDTPTAHNDPTTPQVGEISEI